jgi:lycopene cyclase domain-containing protein
MIAWVREAFGHGFYAALLVVVVLATLLLAWLNGWRDTAKGVLPRLLVVWALVSVPFVLFDAGAHWRGWWDFEPAFRQGGELLGLPWEEILLMFLMAGPLVLLFRLVERRLEGRTVPPRVSRAGLGLLALVAVAFLVLDPAARRERTVIDLVLFWAMLAVLGLTPTLISRTAYWVWLGLAGIFFVSLDWVLSNLPLVHYDPRYNSGRYLLGVPVDDYFYAGTLFPAYLWAFAVAAPRTLARFARDPDAAQPTA